MSSRGALNSNQSSSAGVRFLSVGRGPSGDDGGEPAAGTRILTSPYQLSARCAQFRLNYGDSIGQTVQSRGLGSNRLGRNAVEIHSSIECLGFERTSEEEAEERTAPDENKLTLVISTARSNAALSGPSYLIQKPFVERMHSMCSKWLLVQSMRRLETRMRQTGRTFLTGSGREFSHEEFTPFTLNLNNPNLEEILAKQPGTYLAKPARGTMGQRQQLVHIRADRVQEDLLSFLLSSQFLKMQRSQVILQRYVERPLLIDKRKFDMRVYLLVTNPKRASCNGSNGNASSPQQQQQQQQQQPLSGYFAFLHPGFVRLCTSPYDPCQADLAVHLTNQSVQARHAQIFSQLKEVTTWYPDELNFYLNKRRRMQRPDWARDVMYPKVGAILGYIADVYRHHLDDRDCPTNTFRILGVDMLVGADLRVYLLEFNEYPAWSRQTSVLTDVKPNLWQEAVCLVSEVAIRYRSSMPVGEADLVTRQNFRMVYSSEDPGLARRNVARLYPD